MHENPSLEIGESKYLPRYSGPVKYGMPGGSGKRMPLPFRTVRFNNDT